MSYQTVPLCQIVSSAHQLCFRFAAWLGDAAWLAVEINAPVLSHDCLILTAQFVLVDKWKISIHCEGRRLSISLQTEFPFLLTHAEQHWSLLPQPATISLFFLNWAEGHTSSES
eukprot:EG_transcript_35013